MRKLVKIMAIAMLIMLTLFSFIACDDDSADIIPKPETESEIEKEPEEVENEIEKEIIYNTYNLYNYGSLPQYFNITETIIHSETIFLKNTYDVYGYKKVGRNNVFEQLYGVESYPVGYTVKNTYAWHTYIRQIKIEVSLKPAYKDAVISGSFTFADINRMGGKWMALGSDQKIDLKQDGTLICIWDVTATDKSVPKSDYYFLSTEGSIKIPKTA